MPLSPATRIEIEERMQKIEEKIRKLEVAHFQCPKGITVDESMHRARLDVEDKGCYSAKWKWVPANYYDRPMEERAKILGAPSTLLLCKSLLMENKAVVGSNKDPTNPKYLLVVVQYEATLDVRKLANAIRAMRPVQERLDYNAFDFRVASTEDNDRLTGYAHNSVTPFGLLQDVPIVLSAAVAPLHFFWMGGGHVHLKLGMAVSEFLKATNAMVADISQPRSGASEDDDAAV